MPVAAGLMLVILIIFTGFAFYRRNRKNGGNNQHEFPEPTPLTETERMSIEDRILELLRSHGGELFQSEIVRMIGMPKSTVSTVLNDLHTNGMIIKVKKGRENLIRLSDRYATGCW